MKNENANNTTLNHNKIPEDWKKVKLGEVADLSKIPWKVGDENLPYIGLEHIEENKLRLSGVGNSNDITSNKFLFTENEFLFGKLRPYFRKLYKPKFKGICSTDIWVINSKTNTNKGFLFYLFANQDFVDLAYKGASGTRMPRADWNFMSETEWLIPKNKNEQKAIALVLSSLDDKIDLLHRQNKTLEAMAETLFRQWFIEEAKENWEERPLDEIADYLNGLACQKFPFENDVDKLPVLKIKELRNGFTENSDWVTSKVSEQYMVKNGDVIFSWSGSLLVKIWNGEKCVLNQHLFKVTSEKYPKWFYYFWTKHHLQKFISIAESKATTMGHIKRKDLSLSMVLVSNDAELQLMDKQVFPLIDKLILNNKQIRTLEQLRDTLLPKLMSGEVRCSWRV